MSDETPRDWRGTEITVGAPVIYGAPVGRSIALVEAEVADPMLTKSGRIRLRIIRRAYGSGWSRKEVVDVGADRLIVLNPDSLPPSDAPLTSEKIKENQAKDAEYQRISKSHKGEYVYRDDPVYPGRKNWFFDCPCGATWPGEKECDAR